MRITMLRAPCFFGKSVAASSRDLAIGVMPLACIELMLVIILLFASCAGAKDCTSTLSSHAPSAGLSSAP